MHPRRCNTGDGVRSNSVGIGLASGRISPEGSIRGHRMYTSEYRNFNRAFGRGTPKPYPPPPQPLRKGDILMEAGRLAAEYLVSKGLLSPNSLPGKWWNNNTKGGQMGDYQELRVQDHENVPLPSEGRNLGLARVGNVVLDGGSGRRIFPDDFSPVGPRNHTRGRRRMGPFHKENGRKGPWPESTKMFPVMVENGDDFIGMTYHGEQKIGSDVSGGASKVVTNELPLKDEIPGDSDSELETFEVPDDAGSKASSSSTRKGPPPETDEELSKGLDVANVLTSETMEVNNNKAGDKTEKDSTWEDRNYHASVEGAPIGKHSSDLLRWCSFAKVPTKVRSSLSLRGSRVDQGPITVERMTCDFAPASGSKVPIGDDSFGASTRNSKSLKPDISIVLSARSMDEAAHQDGAFVVDRERCTQSPSFSDGSSSMNQEESNEGPPGFERWSSMVLPNKNDGFVHHVETWESNKRPRESSSGISHDNEDIFLHDLRAKQPCSEVERLSPDEKMVKAHDNEDVLLRDLRAKQPCSEIEKLSPDDKMIEAQDNEDVLLHELRAKEPCSEVEKFSPDEKMVQVVDQNVIEDGLVPKIGVEADLETREEKQLLPSSFKICDLNLMDASEITESTDDLFRNHISTTSSPKIEKEVLLDAGLSINNNLSGFVDVHGLSSDAKEVAVIDVENGSIIEDKVFDASVPKTEAMYSSLESFLHHTENTVDLTDVQDGYGHAISELLGTDISNCSSVPTDIDDLQTQMSLHGQEGIPGDDDPIYLSLGEIPISFLGVWDPPSQDYGKPF